MALPDNTLSSEVMGAPFTGGRALSVTPTSDYETGGVAIENASEGHLYQIWQAKIINKERIEVSAEEVAPFDIHTGPNITEVSLTFDQNMRATFCDVQDGSTYLRWYDSTVPGMVTTNFGTSYKSPRITLDDKRKLQMSANDIIFAYIRSGNLCYRQQRDRFAVEYLLQASTNASRIIKIGMNRANRLQFLMGY